MHLATGTGSSWELPSEGQRVPNSVFPTDGLIHTQSSEFETLRAGLVTKGR